MKISLKKPLAVFDLETTGLNITNDRIVEISILKVHPTGNKESKLLRLNPGIPIPDASSQIHGIYDKDVQDSPGFKEVAKDLVRFLSGCDLAGYNALRFDIPVLMEEFLRADIDFDIKNRHIVDVQNIFMKMEPRTLKGAYRFFCQKDLIDAHSAEADTLATFEILEAQIEKYEGVEYEEKSGNISTPIVNDIKALHEFSKHHEFADLAGQIIFDSEGNEVFHFGKYKGRTVEDVFTTDPSYYDWMMKGEFPLYTKKLITSIKLRMKGLGNVTMLSNKKR